jgi:hypothetical protein
MHISFDINPSTVLGGLTIFLFIAKVVWDKNISWGWILLTLVLWWLVD